ncbi:hypothetical protein ACFWIQ_03050 [Kitasatospora sp. NPDC127059]|uniref:hypothetical protein n=1 Tax=unclassified Kitasatospora TaxID=2633591 RepID=UPI00364DAD42
MPEDSVPIQDAKPEPEPRPELPTPQAKPKQKQKPRRSLGELLRTVIPAVLVVLGLGLTILGFVRFIGTFEDTRAYRATPVCTADAKPGADCATLESGRVKKKEKEIGSDSTDYMLTVSRETAPTGRYSVGKAFYNDVTVGTDVDLKILHGKVFELSYHGHRYQPVSTPYLTIAGFSAMIGFGMIMMVAGGLADLEFMAALALAYAVGASIATVIGSMLLISLQWPLFVTLPISVLCWLIVAAITRSTFEQF